MLLQDTQLFSGTLYENISFACLPDKLATKDEVITALKEAAGDSILDRSEKVSILKLVKTVSNFSVGRNKDCHSQGFNS